MPSSDLDSAIAWFGRENDDEPSVRTYFDEAATAVTHTLTRVDFVPMNTGSTPRIRSSSDHCHRGRERLSRFSKTPPKRKPSCSYRCSSTVARVGIESEPLIAERFVLLGRTHSCCAPRTVRALAQPPVGFIRDSPSTSREGAADWISNGRRRAITDLARWAGMTAGVTCASTTARLQAASDCGTLTSSDALTLRDAFELTSQLRLDHQVAQLIAGSNRMTRSNSLS